MTSDEIWSKLKDANTPTAPNKDRDKAISDVLHGIANRVRSLSWTVYSQTDKAKAADAARELSVLGDQLSLAGAIAMELHKDQADA